MGDLLIKDVAARDSGSVDAPVRSDVLIRDGRVAEVAPSLPQPSGVEVLDGAGHVLVPAFVDAHSHLDKSMLGLPWFPRRPGRSWQQLVDDERAIRASADWDYVRQISRNVEKLVAAGATSTRAFVDIDTDAELRGLEAMLEIKNRFADALTIQIIAFPQSGVAARPGTAELLDRAMAAGADIVGGIDPCMLERDPVAHLDLLFDLAERYGAGIDIHLHEGGQLGAFSAELIIERTRRTGLGGRVVISHPDFLGGIGEDSARRLVDQFVEVGIAITTNVPSSDPKPPLGLMRAAGLMIGSGCDGELDSWGPLNRSDMLLKANQFATRYGFGTDEALDGIYDLVSSGGRRIMGLEEVGPAVGQIADLVLLPGEVWGEPIVTLPAERTVIKAGRVVAVDGRLLS